MQRQNRLAFTLAFLAVSSAAPIAVRAATVQFTPDYSLEGANEGFNDPGVGAARKTAFEYALALMSAQFEARYLGEGYSVRAAFNPGGGSATSATLGSASPNLLYTGINNPVPGAESRYYPAALASHRHLADVNGEAFDISITFNADVDNGTVLGATNWYYGVDATPGGHIDLVSVALHELGHGIGFTGFLGSSGAYSSGLISIYDHFMNASSTGATKLTSLNNSGRMAETTGGDLWWDGAEGTAGNGDVRPKLHAPTTFVPGSSLYHLDEATLGAQLLSPIYSGADHSLSDLERGMLADMGWTLAAIPEAPAVAMLAMAAGVAVVSLVSTRWRTP